MLPCGSGERPLVPLPERQKLASMATAATGSAEGQACYLYVAESEAKDGGEDSRVVWTGRARRGQDRSGSAKTGAGGGASGWSGRQLRSNDGMGSYQQRLGAASIETVVGRRVKAASGQRLFEVSVDGRRAGVWQRDVSWGIKGRRGAAVQVKRKAADFCDGSEKDINSRQATSEDERQKMAMDNGGGVVRGGRRGEIVLL